MKNTNERFNELLGIIERLRSDNGCPWDRKQTPQTISSYLLEETHEAIQAINEGEPDDVREELGDLLFLIVFLCSLYQEKGFFSITEVLAGIAAKMVRRHPHVFSNAACGSEKELRERWLAIKASEKQDTRDREIPAKNLLDSVPKSLPPLRRAQRIAEYAARAGFEWEGLDQVFDKLDEERTELRKALATGNKPAAFEELGDLLFVIVNIGRRLNVNCDDALAAATAKFVKRFSLMEQAISESGDSLAELDAEKRIGYWHAAKNI